MDYYLTQTVITVFPDKISMQINTFGKKGNPFYILNWNEVLNLILVNDKIFVRLGSLIKVNTNDSRF